MESVEKIQEVLDNIQSDVTKFGGGNKSAGTRIRKAMQEIKKLAQDGHKQTMFFEAIPNVTLYGGIVVIMMCAIGSGYDVMNMYSKIHTEAVPWVTIFLGDWAQVWIITRIAGIIVIASIVVMMIGGLKHIKSHPEEGGSPANVFMEVLLGKSVECLAHTISYARLGIMMIEGLIVYIQSLRLHLYEFFTKWYEGGSEPFKNVVPEMYYNQFKWNRK